MNRHWLVCGGSWLNIPEYMRKGITWAGSHRIRNFGFGFRVVQDPEYRVLRGASWFNVPDPMIAAFRNFGVDWNGYYGFRVACDE